MLRYHAVGMWGRYTEWIFKRDSQPRDLPKRRSCQSCQQNPFTVAPFSSNKMKPRHELILQRRLFTPCVTHVRRSSWVKSMPTRSDHTTNRRTVDWKTNSTGWSDYSDLTTLSSTHSQTCSETFWGSNKTSSNKQGATPFIIPLPPTPPTTPPPSPPSEAAIEVKPPEETTDRHPDKTPTQSAEELTTCFNNWNARLSRRELLLSHQLQSRHTRFHQNHPSQESPQQHPRKYKQVS